MQAGNNCSQTDVPHSGYKSSHNLLNDLICYQSSPCAWTVSTVSVPTLLLRRRTPPLLHRWDLSISDVKPMCEWRASCQLRACLKTPLWVPSLLLVSIRGATPFIFYFYLWSGHSQALWRNEPDPTQLQNQIEDNGMPLEVKVCP